MKNIKIIFSIAICSLLLLSFTFKKKSIIGNWKNDRFEIEYQFTKDGNAYFEQSGYGTSMSYLLDSKKSPMWLDFTMQRGGNKMEIAGLVEIVHKDTIIIEQFTPNLSKHPTEFSEGGDMMNKRHKLYRIK